MVKNPEQIKQKTVQGFRDLTIKPVISAGDVTSHTLLLILTHTYVFTKETSLISVIFHTDLNRRKVTENRPEGCFVNLPNRLPPT